MDRVSTFHGVSWEERGEMELARRREERELARREERGEGVSWEREERRGERGEGVS